MSALGDICTFDDGACFDDGGPILWRPRPAALLFITRRPLAFCTVSLSLPPPSGITEHPNARTYRLGADLFASVVPYVGWASVVLVDMVAGDNLAIQWTPERGFDRDPSPWLERRRGRLATRSPGYTILELSELLPGLVTVQTDAVFRRAR